MLILLKVLILLFSCYISSHFLTNSFVPNNQSLTCCQCNKQISDGRVLTYGLLNSATYCLGFSLLPQPASVTTQSNAQTNFLTLLNIIQAYSNTTLFSATKSEFLIFSAVTEPVFTCIFKSGLHDFERQNKLDNFVTFAGK